MKTKTLLAVVIAGTLIVAGVLAAALLAKKPREEAPAKTTREEAVAHKDPHTVIMEKIQAGVERQLRESGASVQALQVQVAVHRDGGIPFEVTYQGLKNFKPAAGEAPPSPDGTFGMSYAGGGTWQGSLAGMTFVVPVATTDNIDMPFVDDPVVIGEWNSVDFVGEPGAFNPEKQSYRGKLFLAELVFKPGGKTGRPNITWTKGFLIDHRDKTASRYEIKEVAGQPYLFLEWKSGDVTISGMKPSYYVLEKKA